MKSPRFLATCIGLASLTAVSLAQETIEDVLADPALDINRPADRGRAVERIRAIEEASLERARVKARTMGIPMRLELPDGRVTEIVGLDENDDFLIYTTHNINAAISTAANLVNAASYNLNGSGMTVGVWDGGAVKNTHQEFATGSRVTIMDGASFNDHATHVAGTIAAAGVSANAKGMAIQALVHSYDWNSDTSEMLNRGATAPGQADKIHLSNHSYGYVEGWDGNTWRGVGTDQNAYDPQFGQYSSAARTWDDIAYKVPYYLPFKSAGNDNSNNPAQGASVVIGGNTVTYDRAIHPPGDGLYRNTTTNSTSGYENIGTNGTAKNIMTVGAANDAVTSGQRDPSKSTLTGFSSRGPTDDGRIKPDIVANGAGLFSPVSGSNNTSYSTYNGTSMSSPNAVGSATLLVELYANRFNGGAMRASTLKGLIIHTATDIGNAGPDYHYGWGLMNTKEAADLIIDHQTNPSKNRMVEDQLTTSTISKIHTFAWDGTSPLRTTLCWTDPPGDSSTTHDLRTPRLKNNLNLKLIAPNGNEYSPFVMPFVGTWTVASMSLPATTGINNTDPVEQVLIANPGQTGNWQAVVSYTGTLTNNLQNYSLLVSGVTDGVVPLVLQSITPNSGNVGTTVIADITGTALGTDTQVRLRKAGRSDIIGTSVQMLSSTTLRCQFNLAGAASGAWNLVATNPDQETYTLPDAFNISGSLTSLWSENFDGMLTGWISTSQQGSNSWSVVTTASHSPTKSYFASGPVSTSITHLTSPQITMPESASNLSLEFWHRYTLQADRDCGKLYLSTDNGATWFEVTSTNSGVAFTQTGYNSTMASNGQTNPFAGQQGWSGSTSGAFVRTTINFTNIPKFTGAGKSLRLRWTIATNNQGTSAGWWVDSISLLSDSSTPNQSPVISVAAGTDTSEFQTAGPTTYHVLRGTGTNLSVTTTDDAGEEYLQYTWQATGPAPVIYTLNESNSAKSTTATFSTAGDYAITVTALDTGGLFANSTVNVRVLETPTFLVTPESAILGVGGNQQFSAMLINQFGTPNATQPSPINWSASGGGTIGTGGFFTATTVGGPYFVTATSGQYTDTAEVTVNPTQAGIELQNLNRTYSGSPQVVTAITNPSDLAYSVTYNGQSTAPTNGGSYDVVATITNPNYQGNTSGTLVISYSVSYQGNDNTSGTAPANQTKFQNVDLTLAINSGNLSKTGFSFIGWNTAADGSGTDYPAGVIYSNNASLSLYAKWVPGADGTWIQTTAGPFDWGTSDNWSGGTVAAGADRTASFTPNIIAAQVVNLESARTIGNMTFTDSTTSSNNLVVSGANTLTLDRTDTTKPTINVTQSGRQLTISSKISGNDGLRKTGAGDLLLGGDNDFTGGVDINGGKFIIYEGLSANAFGSSSNAITFTGNAEINNTNNAYTIAQSIAINSGVVATLSGANAENTIVNGAVTGSGELRISSASNTMSASLASISNNHTGILWIGSTANALNVTANSLADGAGKLKMGSGTGVISLTFGASTAAPIVLTNRQLELAGTTGNITISNNASAAANTLAFNQDLAFTTISSGNKRLIFGGSNTGINTFEGNMANNGTSTTTLEKTGSGTWALGGSNSYSGDTVLAASGTTGRLIFQGSQALSANTKLVFAQSSSNVQSVRFLDDGAGMINFNRPIEFGGTNTTQSLNLFVGNNNTANLGSSSGTTTGSTIQVGNITFASVAADTHTTTINATGSNGFRLQTGSITLNNLVNRAAGSTTVTALNPTTANMTVASVTMAGGNTGSANDGIPVLRLDGTSPDNHVTGTISNASDHLTGQALGLQKQNASIWILTGANTYSGTTTISGGTLQLGDGTSGKDGTIDNTSGITNNATLVFNRFGAVSSSVAISGTGAVTKTGPGSQILSGTDTYTGATSVDAGKLFINGSLSNTNVALTVNNGATLGGTGIIGRNVTIADGGKLEFDISTAAAGHDRLDISSGRSFAFSGASELTITSSGGALPGTYILVTGGNNITGIAPAKVNLPEGWMATISISENNLLLNVISTGGSPPTLVGISDDQGGPVIVNTLVNYTVDFSEDMDESTFNSDDFGNTGTAPATIGAIQETSPGVFTVQVTPTGAGSLQLRINQGATLKSAAGNDLVTSSALLDDTLIDVQTPPPPGVLAVTAGGLVSTGTFGRVFTPASAEYTLENTGGVSIDWTTAKSAAWVSLNSISGTLAPGASTTVTVSINTAAKDLEVGTFNDTVTLTNTTNGNGSTSRGVSLTVEAIPVVVSLGNLSQTYDGSSKPVSVTTDPTPVGYTVTYNGEANAPIEVGSYAVVVTVTQPNHTGTASDTLVIGPSVPGPVSRFAISPIASSQTVGTPITGITITALDADDEIATDFTGSVNFGGTAGITGTSANFVDGVLTAVSVTPTLAGSDLTFTVNDGAGHTGTVTIATILSVFDDWASANGLTGDDALPNSDSDRDGLTNLQEFAFGTHPTAGASGPIVYIAGGSVTKPGMPMAQNTALGEGADLRAIFGRRKDYLAAGLSYTVEFSAGLDRWVQSDFEPTILTGENSDGDIEAMSLPFPLLIPVDDAQKKPTFFRVGVSMN